MGKCHKILVVGELKDSKNQIDLRLPFQDINSNLWQISLNEISIEYKAISNTLSAVSCNFVTDITYNATKQIVNCEPFLTQILVKGNIGEKQTIYLDKNWFYISNAQENIALTFHVLENGRVAKNIIFPHCFVYVSVLLQRVK